VTVQENRACDSLRGKVALVTGGNRGIGAACVRHFAADGADVAIGYVQSADQAKAVAGQLRALSVAVARRDGRERAVAGPQGFVSMPSALRATATMFSAFANGPKVGMVSPKRTDSS
jgi:NAD(P)-dependent dehydrogenase (short-subunit alcohol dehydrogenase family)